MNRLTRTAIVALVLAPGQILAQDPATETVPGPTYPLRTGVLAIGAPAVALAFMPVDLRIRDAVRGPSLQNNGPAKTTARLFRELGEPTVPAALGVAFLTGWAFGHEPTRQASLHVLESVVASAAVVSGIKFMAGRARPFEDRDPWNYGVGQGFDGHGFRSFPSGHTSQAFVLAASIQGELREHWGIQSTWLGASLYSAAALTGLSRVYHDRHWASDVIMGAAVGTLVGRAARALNHPAR